MNFGSPFAVAFSAFTTDIVLVLQRFHHSLDGSNGFITDQMIG